MDQLKLANTSVFRLNTGLMFADDGPLLVYVDISFQMIHLNW